MRRREIQSFALKLSDLKEYEVAKQERLARTNEERSGGDGSSAAATGSTAAADGVDPMKTPEVTMSSVLPKLGGGPKTKQEIRARIGFPTDLA